MAVSGVTAVAADTTYGTIIDSPVVSREVIGAKATEAAVREYFADIPVMIAVARCESTFRHTLEDGSILRGVVDNRDTGVMQINLGYHEATATNLGLDVENIYDNMAYARHLYETQGVQPWSASRPCWGNTLAYAG